MFFSAIVFDFDGIIVESTEVKSAAFYEVALEWGEDAALRMAEYHAKNFGVSRFAKFNWFFKKVLGKDLSPEMSAYLNNRFSTICVEKIIQAPLVPGFADAIAKGNWQTTTFWFSTATWTRTWSQMQEFQYFAIVWKNSRSGSGWIDLWEIEFYGYDSEAE